MRHRPDKTDPRPNRYYHSADALYRVEARIGAHVVVENCRNGQLIDVPLDELRRWTLLDGGTGTASAQA